MFQAAVMARRKEDPQFRKGGWYNATDEESGEIPMTEIPLHVEEDERQQHAEGRAKHHSQDALTEMERKTYYALAGKVYQSARAQAGGFFNNLYSMLDLIRPYFNVELQTVLKRLKEFINSILLLIHSINSDYFIL